MSRFLTDFNISARGIVMASEGVCTADFVQCVQTEPWNTSCPSPFDDTDDGDSPTPYTFYSVGSTVKPTSRRSSQKRGYDLVTTCGLLMRNPGKRIAAGAKAMAMRWSS